MNMSLILALIWVVTANVSAMIPSKDNYWTRAYILIAIGLPLLGYIIYENGFWMGLVFVVAGASMLRWPLIYLGRWLRRMLGGAGRS